MTWKAEFVLHRDLYHSFLYYCQHLSLFKDFNCTLKGLKHASQPSHEPEFMCLATPLSSLLMLIDNRSLEERDDGWGNTQRERIWEHMTSKWARQWVEMGWLVIKATNRIQYREVFWKEMWFPNCSNCGIS